MPIDYSKVKLISDAEEFVGTGTPDDWVPAKYGKFRVAAERETRTCFRCGTEFEQMENERQCSACASREKSSSTHLSTREVQVSNLVSQGKANKEIAWNLHLSEGTIKEYLNRIFRKVGVSNRVELALWVLQQKIPNLSPQCEHCRQMLDTKYAG
jgi:DNA-binding CsgD family transcriptional regulator